MLESDPRSLFSAGRMLSREGMRGGRNKATFRGGKNLCSEPFPTYLGWLLGPGVMIFTFLTSFILYKNYLKKEAAKEAEKNSKDK